MQAASLNLYQRFVRWLIRQAFTSFLIPGLWRLYGSQRIAAQQEQLRALPAGTLGRGVADVLAQHQLRLIPHYENHDLKHVLLGYDMTPEDELKLKAFMLGNGDYSLPGFALLAFILLTPELWPELWQHYQRGRRTQSIASWQLTEYATQDVVQLRRQIGLCEVRLTQPKA